MLGGKRIGRRQRPTIHRATCQQVRKKSKSRVTHFTIGNSLKACAEDLQELTKWLESQSLQPKFCDECQPLNEAVSAAVSNTAEKRLTKAGREILDYIIEIAVISLDNADSRYALTVSNLSRVFDKSAAQLRSTLQSLIQANWIHVLPASDKADPLSADTLVFPTAEALRTESAFAELSQKQADAKLRQLYPAWPRV